MAPFRLIKAALPHLRQRRGCVLNIGSVNTYCGEPDLLPYSVSKGALMTMTRNLGDTLMREGGVRVNQINPGWTLTEAEQQLKMEQGLTGVCLGGNDGDTLFAFCGNRIWKRQIMHHAMGAFSPWVKVGGTKL